jgi:LytS/YehU family sensor histidine kinase
MNYGQQEWVRVREEVDHIEDYLGIEKMRLGERLHVEFAVEPATLEEYLPPFTLLPLVENAVKHGFEQSLTSGVLRLSISRTAQALSITVENPVEPGAPEKKKEGYGLLGLKKRLANAYAEGADLSVSRNGGSFRVTLSLPLKVDR